MYMASQHVDRVKPKSVSTIIGVWREKLGCGHKDRVLSDWQDHVWISGRESPGSSLGSLPIPGILKLSGSGVFKFTRQFRVLREVCNCGSWCHV